MVLTVPMVQLMVVRATDGVLMVPTFQMFACNNRQIILAIHLLLQVNIVSYRCIVSDNHQVSTQNHQCQLWYSALLSLVFGQTWRNQVLDGSTFLHFVACLILGC